MTKREKLQQEMVAKVLADKVLAPRNWQRIVLICHVGEDSAGMQYFTFLADGSRDSSDEFAEFDARSLAPLRLEMQKADKAPKPWRVCAVQITKAKPAPVVQLIAEYKNRRRWAAKSSAALIDEFRPGTGAHEPGPARRASKKPSADELLWHSVDARRKGWEKWGTVDQDLLGQIINPSFMGGPRWPALRQAFRLVHQRESRETLLASEGLADPFDEGSPRKNGFGLELYAIAPDILVDVAGTWLWDLVWQASQNAAAHGGFAELLDEHKLLSLELFDVGIPKKHARRFLTPQRSVGVLLGLNDADMPAHVKGPLSKVRLVNVKLLTRDELAFVADGGARARATIAKKLATQGPVLTSSLERESVLA